jgi:hypothetical protein
MILYVTHIFLNSQFIDPCMNLKYRVQNNVSSGEIKRSIKIKILKKIFAVRRSKTHGKEGSLPCA